MPFLPTKRHTISSTNEVGLLRRPVPGNTPSASTPPRRFGNLYSARGAHFSFDDRPVRELHQDEQTYDALVGNKDRSSTQGNGVYPAVPPLPHKNETKSPAQLYEDQYRPRLSKTFGDRPARPDPVVAYLRTNVIVKDEYSLVTDLSLHFSVRYSKPQSAVMITVDHSTCLLLGATFEPAYVLTVTASESDMHPDLNRQNVAHIQSFMASILGVSPDRGIVRFDPVREENFGVNGITTYTAMDRGQRAQKARHSIGGYGMPPDVARTFVQPPSRNSSGGRPRPMLEPVADAEAEAEAAAGAGAGAPNTDIHASSIPINQDKPWLPIDGLVTHNQRSPSPAQRQTPSPPPTINEKSPLRNPLASNPPSHRFSPSLSSVISANTNGIPNGGSTDWRPARPNGTAERMDTTDDLTAMPSLDRAGPSPDARQDRPARRAAKLVKRQSLTRPASRPTSATYAAVQSLSSFIPPPSDDMFDGTAPPRPESHGSTDAIPPSVPSRASPTRKQGRRMSGLLNALRRH